MNHQRPDDHHAEYDVMGDALGCAMVAAEAASQACTAIWDQMTAAERDAWLKNATTAWPRLDLFLEPILQAAARCIENENNERAA